MGEKPETGKVNLTVDTATIFADNEKLTGHLRSPDFFDVEKFPTATFTSTAIAPAEGGKYTVDASSAELFAIEAEYGLPFDCCAQPHDVTLRQTASVDPSWQAAGAQLMAHVEAPPGAFDGLESVHITLDGNTVGAFPNGIGAHAAPMPPDACAADGRIDFMLVVSPEPLVGATSAPVNPVAIR